MPPKKMGRPPVDHPKDQTIRIRVDEQTLKKLDHCSTVMGSNRSEVVRKGIDLVFDSLNK